MKHIAYTHREFRLCEWPEEPKPNAFGRVHLLREDSYLKAVTSAMENGIAFADQEGVKQFIFKTTNEIRGTMLIWQPKDGDNWPAPEGVEIVTYWRNNEKEEWGPWHKNRGTRFSCEVAVLKRKEGVHFVHELINHAEVCTATILKSESVEKKEEWKNCHQRIWNACNKIDWQKD